MIEKDAITPFGALQRLERLGNAHGGVVPAQAEVGDTWSGIAFRLGGSHYVTPMSEVAEILSFPQLSRVPHAKSWVLGIANIRGSLLPVLDLNGFLGRGLSQMSRLSRVLVLDTAGVFTGLLLDEILGMRRFNVADWRHSRTTHAPAAAFLNGCFVHEAEEWPVFNLEALVEEPNFRRVAG